jgi:hypothetical protein
MFNTEVDIIFGIVYIPTGNKCLSSQDANSHLGKQFLAFSKKKITNQIKSCQTLLPYKSILGGVKWVPVK